MGGDVILLTVIVFVTIVLAGVPVAFSMAIASMFGIFMAVDFQAALSVAQNTAFSGLRVYIFIVVPLFTVMGLLFARCGAAADLFNIVNRRLGAVRGRLAVATIGGQAIFAAVTGVGLAAVIAFSNIAYPEMRRRQYRRDYAMGCIAGSSILGLLIPPSVFLVLWAVLTEQSVGHLFVAGIGPGLLLASLFAAWAIISATLNPRLTPLDGRETQEEVAAPTRAELRSQWTGGVGVLATIVVVLGGIYTGKFTPTEAAAFGVVVAFLLALAKGMRLMQFFDACVDAGRASAPILLLILGALMYSRFLAVEGVPDLVQAMLEGRGLGPDGMFLAMIVVWLVMGMLIDSLSIMLLTVPIFWPIAQWWDLGAIPFALIGVLIIEAGILSPPFGLGVFAVQSAVRDPEARVLEAFRGSFPYMICILITAAFVYVFPGLATFLPSVML